MKKVLCAREGRLWQAAEIPDGAVLVQGPTGDAPWAWTEDPSTIDALFCSVLPENIDDFTSLRWVQIDSAGFSQLIPANLPRRGVTATNAAGVFDVPIAEWCVAMMVALVRHLPEMLRNQAATVWDRATRFQSEIRGATVGFWGYGGLAREAARLAKAMGLRVHVLARGQLRTRAETFCLPGTGDPGAQLPDQVFGGEEIAEFLGGLDFLVMALPLTEATRGICQEKHLRALKKTAFLLNPARGPLIDQEALLRALREQWFAGAALDTHYQYPLPPDHPLWSMPNVLLTPHIAGSTGSQGFTTRVNKIFAENLRSFLAGGALWNEIPPVDLQPATSPQP